MPKRSRTKDLNQIAASVVAQATGEPLDRGTVSKIMAEMGRKGGQKGGKVRASRMTAKELSEAGRRAVEARWAKARKS